MENTARVSAILSNKYQYEFYRHTQHYRQTRSNNGQYWFQQEADSGNLLTLRSSYKYESEREKKKNKARATEDGSAVTGCRLQNQGSISSGEQIFPVSTISRPALGKTQATTIQRVPVACIQ
jgi:hypothetical protein